MALSPESTLEALLHKRERAATRRVLSFLTETMLDAIADHAFVVRRWHSFSKKIEGFLKALAVEDSQALLQEFYRITAEIDGGADMLPPANPEPLIIRHVKWKTIEGFVVPTGDTTQLPRLPDLSRGTLIFVPEEEDYDEERDEFSRP